MSVVFVKSRHHYASYVDYWTLVELSDFETVFINEIDLSRTCVYVMTPMNGEVTAFINNHKNEPRRCMLIWWMLERFEVINHEEIDGFAAFFDAIWISCRHAATIHPAFKHVILGSHPNLGNDPHDLEYHFTHQSYETGRRAAVYDPLRKMGLKEGPNAWGEERDLVLRKSATMVHVQQSEAPFYTPLRFALAAAYALPLITETLADPYPLDFVDNALCDKLPDLVAKIADDPGERGGRLFQALCLDRTFRSEVEKSL